MRILNIFSYYIMYNFGLINGEYMYLKLIYVKKIFLSIMIYM